MHFVGAIPGFYILRILSRENTHDKREVENQNNITQAIAEERTLNALSQSILYIASGQLTIGFEAPSVK